MSTQENLLALVHKHETIRALIYELIETDKNNNILPILKHEIDMFDNMFNKYIKHTSTYRKNKILHAIKSTLSRCRKWF